jgi:hypothetical protein
MKITNPVFFRASVEKYIFQTLLPSVWGKIFQRYNDGRFLSAVSSLRHIQAEQLEIPARECNPVVWDRVGEQMQAICIDAAPSEKLIALQAACSSLLSFLRSISSANSLMNRFILHLVFILVKCSLPNLKAHLGFMRLFCVQENNIGALLLGCVSFSFSLLLISQLENAVQKIENLSPSRFSTNIPIATPAAAPASTPVTQAAIPAAPQVEAVRNASVRLAFNELFESLLAYNENK